MTMPLTQSRRVEASRRHNRLPPSRSPTDMSRVAKFAHWFIEYCLHAGARTKHGWSH